MFNFLGIIYFLSFTGLIAFGDVVSTCNNNETSLALLDVATDIIAKAKLNIPVCSDVTSKPIDCADVLRNGFKETDVYTIWPKSRLSEDKPLQVYCDMETSGGGWTVVQRRGDFGRATEYFFKDWESYKKGFGDIREDFWLGNDHIFALTNQRLYSIRIDLKSVDGESRYSHYDAFWIDDENHMYTLHIKDYKGNAGDSLTSQHDNVKFSTKDKDNDNQKDESCALKYKGGWWYNACHVSNLNGLYFKGLHESMGNGIHWNSWKFSNESLKFTEMKIRPSNF